MKRKLFTLSLFIILGFLSLTSCNKDEGHLHKDESKEDTWYWGFFSAEINGEKISLENNKAERVIKSNRSSYYFSGDWEVVPDSVNIMGTLINYNDSSELRITLYDLSLTERYITKSENLQWNESCINIVVNSDCAIRTQTKYYVPRQENSFRVEIINVLWISSAKPIIEVKLDGVLYNKEDADDVIVIQGIYGTR